MLGEQEQREWYSNQRLYEMMVELSKGLESTNAELGKTQVLIRDYNGLREEVEKMKIFMAANQGSKKDLQWWAMFAVAIMAIIVAFVK